MAKKKPDDDDELLHEEVPAEEVVIEPVDSGEVEPVEIDAPLESADDLEPIESADVDVSDVGIESVEIGEGHVEAVAGDVEDVPVGVGDDGGDVLVGADQEEAPRPAVHWFTWTLIGLNFVAALAFPYFLIQDHQKRQEYAYAVLRTELAMNGLPTEEEEAVPTAARATLPNHRISAEYMKKVMSDRGVNVTDPVEGIDEPIASRIAPSDLDKDILREHFGEHYVDGVKTVEDEVKRFQASLANDIRTAAEESYKLVKGGDAAVRARTEKLLLPLALDTYQAEKLDKRIQAAQGKALQTLYVEAAQRRMAFDFLLPLEMFRPGDPKVHFVEKFGDLDTPLDTIMGRVTARVASTIAPKFDPNLHLGEAFVDREGKLVTDRDTVEKRLTSAFTLLSIAYLRKPDGELLYPKLAERLPLVLGQYDFAVAAGLFPGRIRLMNERVLANLREGREGFEVVDKDGKVLRGWGFHDRYEQDVQQIRYTQQDIKKADIRLQDLQTQKQRYEQLLGERTKQLSLVIAQIAEARKQTAKENNELRVLQDGLFDYQRQLATSDEDLSRLNEQIRKAMSRKGGK